MVSCTPLLTTASSCVDSAAMKAPLAILAMLTAAPAGLLDRGEETLACDERDVVSLLAVLNSGVAYLWWKAQGDGFHVKSATYAALPDLRPLVAGTPLAVHGATLHAAMEHGERRVTQSGTGDGWLTENANLWETAGDVLNAVDAALLDGLGLNDENHMAALRIERSANITGG